MIARHAILFPMLAFALLPAHNKVMHRLRAFLASLIVLRTMWGLLAYDLVIAGKG